MKPHDVHVGMYLHPWDVVDEGPKDVLQRIKELGVKAVNLATSYHSGRYYLPHNPKKRVYSAEEGVVYFKPDPSLYQECVLQPRRSQRYPDVDVLRVLTDSAQSFGIEVNSWTVTLHNSVFVSEHPELAVVNVHGDRDGNFLCPNQPQARKYVAALAADLATNYDIRAIMLESASYPWGLVHGDHHEMFGLPIGPLLSEFMTTCFCQACKETAKGHGIDLEAVRKLVREIVEYEVNLPVNVLKSVPTEESVRSAYLFSLDFPEVRELLRFKRDTVENLFTEVRSRLREEGSKVKLQIITVAGFGGDVALGRGIEGTDFRSLGKIVDGVNLITYVPQAELVYYLVAWTKFMAGNCPIFAALRPSHPILYTPEAIAAEISAALAAGAKGIDFYNYGWINPKTLESIREALGKALTQG